MVLLEKRILEDIDNILIDIKHELLKNDIDMEWNRDIDNNEVIIRVKINNKVLTVTIHPVDYMTVFHVLCYIDDLIYSLI